VQQHQQQWCCGHTQALDPHLLLALGQSLMLVLLQVQPVLLLLQLHVQQRRRRRQQQQQPWQLGACHPI
jgi:hypothetical protein